MLALFTKSLPVQKWLKLAQEMSEDMYQTNLFSITADNLSELWQPLCQPNLPSTRNMGIVYNDCAIAFTKQSHH